MWFLLIDSYTNRLEVVKMSSTTTEATARALTDIFVRYGLPETLVTNNWQQFASDDFATFCAARGIKHLTIAPYQPQSNSLAERLIESFKTAVDKLRCARVSLNDAVCHIVTSYRPTPHSTTGQSPAELLYGRRMRTLLDLMAPRHSVREEALVRKRRNFGKRTRERSSFETGALVWICIPRPGDKWIKGNVLHPIATRLYTVKACGFNKERKCHANQLRRRATTEIPAEKVVDEDAPSTPTPLGLQRGRANF